MKFGIVCSLVLSLSGLLVSNGFATAQTAPQIDGELWQAEWGYAFRIRGMEGICENCKNKDGYDNGRVILKIYEFEGSTFWGSHMFGGERWFDVVGTIDGSKVTFRTERDVEWHMTR